MTEINNIDKLTAKIYEEGVEKAKNESKSIISQAEDQRQLILSNTEKEAARILADATREAARLTRSVENELRLKGRQFIHDLKTEIQNLLSKEILEKSAKEAFADVSFLQSIISEAVSYWKSTEELDLILPEKLKHKLDEAFQGSIKHHTENLTISFNDKLSGGFRIGKKSDHYEISFGEYDFITLFRPYLMEQTDKLLFTKSS